MPADEFKEFLKREQESTQEAAKIDWTAERDTWLKRLDELYFKIIGYLKDYTKSSLVVVDFDEIKLTEDNIGQYKAKRLRLRIGSKTVTFAPIGTFLIGSKGRVDVHGPSGDARLLLVGRNVSSPRDMIKITVMTGPPKKLPPVSEPKEKIDWVWKLVSPAPQMTFTDINEEVVKNMILEVANG